jgi:hypothetical protein
MCGGHMNSHIARLLIVKNGKNGGLPVFAQQ